jgi:hypothetical protein
MESLHYITRDAVTSPDILYKSYLKSVGKCRVSSNLKILSYRPRSCFTGSVTNVRRTLGLTK